MQNSNLNKEKINKMLKDPVVRTVIVSFLTIVVTLGLIALAAWYYRDQIFKVLAKNYSAQLSPKADNLVFNPQSKEESKVETVVNPEDTVVSSVKKAKPAVVSIIVSKDVPKYDVTYDQSSDPFGGLFPGFFQTPIYKQNGTERKQIGSGSGFLISSDGMIVTNKHVVADTDAIYEVQLNNGKKYTARVLARDGVLDVALVKISANDLPYLNLADSDTLDVGETVIAIGNALGEFKNTVSVGVVSGLSRSVVAGNGMGMSERLDKVIQTDAAINPGTSGALRHSCDRSWRRR
jgi:S1-C subfamily serine protease